MPDWHNVRIVAGEHGKSAIVFVDGMPLKGVYHVEAIVDTTDVTRVRLEMYCTLNQDLEEEKPRVPDPFV